MVVSAVGKNQLLEFKRVCALLRYCVGGQFHTAYLHAASYHIA